MRIVIQCSVLLLLLFSDGGISSAQEAPERFRRLDRNGDNLLTRDEIPGSVFDDLDSNRDSSVTVTEAIAWAKRTGNGDNQSTSRSQANESQGASKGLLSGFTVHRDIAYANTQNPNQRLDLYVPNSSVKQDRFPIVVYLHGGGWESGNRDGGQRFIEPVLQTRRYAVATVDYRLSREVQWPAQLHDCKAALRWIRANAQDFECDATKIGVLGTSAGGHLAAMLGVTNGESEFEGSVGLPVKRSYKVNCVIDFYGPTDLIKLGEPLGETPSPISRLLGGSVPRRMDLAKSASPLLHVSEGDPPFLIIHGDRDGTVPISQSEILHQALQKVRVESYFTVVINGQHGYFGKPEVDRRCIDFLDRYLLGLQPTIATSPVQ